MQPVVRYPDNFCQEEEGGHYQPHSTPPFSSSDTLAAVEKAAQLTASGQKDDAVAKVFELLGTGTYLHKFSSSGKVSY